MESVTTVKQCIARKDLQALTNGRYDGDRDKLLDALAHALLRETAATLRQTAPGCPGEWLLDAPMKAALIQSLQKVFLSDPVEGETEVPTSLSSAKWTPEEVLARTAMSRATLYRADGVRFYSVVPTGMQNGRAYPAWQFVGDIPSVMPQMLTLLHGKAGRQVNSFFVAQQDALNDLTPAEVLAGLPFDRRGALDAAQRHLLALPQPERIRRVIGLAKLELIDLD